MRFQEKPQVVGESDTKKWVIAGIPLRASLKPIYTKLEEKECDGEECPTTPNGEESRITTTLTCPPAPKKRKASLKYHFREFFTPPDLEAVFMRHAEKAS